MFKFFKKAPEAGKEKDHSTADEIRKYAKIHFVTPARQRGDDVVTFSASDIHVAEGESGHYSTVCGAIDSKKFLEFARVELSKRSGPKDGAAARWTFKI
jgi:hypothetical protein